MIAGRHRFRTPDETFFHFLAPVDRIYRALALGALLGAGSAGAEPHPDPHQVMERYCFDCHGDGLKKGGMSLDKLLEITPEDANGEADWRKVWKITRHEMMPPAGEDQPNEEERQALTRWIEGAQLGVDHEDPDPGRVTIRRLNRMEYEFTVTDLFGAEIVSEGTYSSDSSVASMRLRDRLPPDDTAFGFDNIGDFQSLSPALLEKYFSIAESIVDQVIAFDGPSFPMRTLDGGALRIDRPEDTQRAEHEADFKVDTAGDYQIEMQFTLGGWIDFGGAYDFSLYVDDETLTEEIISVGGQKTHRYSEVLKLEEGMHRLAFVTDALEPDSRGRLNPLDLRPRIRVIGPMDEGTARYPESHQRIFFKGEPPTDEDGRREYAREIVKRVVDRAFRRPADEGTVERLVTIVMRHDNFERGVGEAISAILTSPRFLFRAELQPQPNDPAEVHPIDEFALASRLSYLLWLSLPDDELIELAEEGRLRENLEPQLKRMLDDPKSARFFEDFPGQWLRTRNVLMTPITRRDGDLNPVRGAMKRETEMLFEHIVRNDLDLIELITADYSFLNQRLAEYYGIPGVEGGEMRKVELPEDSRRGGLLGHGSFLVSTSNPNRTSPVKRGLFVLENLLAIEPPPPPPDIPTLDEAKSGGAAPKTVREQLILHREEKSCASCHAHFDPIGLVLENFDVIGRWRDEENGEPILPSETTVSGDQLGGIDDLKRYFSSRRDRFYHAVTEKLMIYALGRGLEPADAVTVDRIAGEMMRDGGTFSGLLMAVVESPAFQTRRGDDGKTVEPQRSIVPPTPPADQRKGRRFNRREFQAAQEKAKEAKEAAEAAEAKEPAEPTTQ